MNFSRVTQDHLKHCAPQKPSIFTSKHSMSHAPSLLFPFQMSTTSLSTLSICTPIRPTTRPSSRPLLMSSSHGDNTCADSSNVSFGPMPESTSPTCLVWSSRVFRGRDWRWPGDTMWPKKIEGSYSEIDAVKLQDALNYERSTERCCEWRNR